MKIRVDINDLLLNEFNNQRNKLSYSSSTMINLVIDYYLRNECNIDVLSENEKKED